MYLGIWILEDNVEVSSERLHFKKGNSKNIRLENLHILKFKLYANLTSITLNRKIHEYAYKCIQKEIFAKIMKTTLKHILDLETCYPQCTLI